MFEDGLMFVFIRKSLANDGMTSDPGISSSSRTISSGQGWSEVFIIMGAKPYRCQSFVRAP
jgi:hypothetical protein